MKAPEGFLEGIVLPGSWDASEGVCQVLIGDTVGYEAPFFADGNQPFMPICTISTPAIGDQYAPVGGERVQVWRAAGGYVCTFEHGLDDTQQVPSGERWISHRATTSDPDSPSWDAQLQLTNDGPTTGDGLGGTRVGGTAALTRTQTGSGMVTDLNDTLRQASTKTPGGMSSVMDDIAQKLTISPVASLETMLQFDAVTQSISHLVPSGGMVALGALAADLADAKYAGINNDILTTFGGNINSANLQTIINLAHAMVTAGIPNASNLIPLIVASLISNVDVPDGSSVVRMLT
jgi:hypothetical protein